MIMKKIKLALVGCAGRMGREIIKELKKFSECDLISVIEEKKSKLINKKLGKSIISYDKKTAFQSVDVIIDFSTPESSLESAKIALQLKKKIVIGTTGLNNAQIAGIKKASKKIAVVFAPNMSIGINLLLELVQNTSKIFLRDTSVEILDVHHKNKKDAPSGTALALGKAVAEGRKISLKKISSMKPNNKRKKKINQLNFFCKRQGKIVGEHSAIFTNSGEEIELRHKAFNRSIYAVGAIKAAIWILKRKKGFYKMSDILGIG